jgi:hypothetical protein
MGQMTKLERPVIRWIEEGRFRGRGQVITLKPPDILEIRDKGAKYPCLKRYSLGKLGALYIGRGEFVKLESIQPDAGPDLVPAGKPRTKKGGASGGRQTMRQKRRVVRRRPVAKKRVSSRAGRKPPKKADRRGIPARVPGKRVSSNGRKRRGMIRP